MKLTKPAAAAAEKTEVDKWLEGKGMGQYGVQFQRLGAIELADLKDLEAEDLKGEGIIGVPLRRLLKAISQL